MNVTKSLGTALVFVLVLGGSAAAADPYPLAVADRPLAFNERMLEAGLDYGIGLNKSRAFDDMLVSLTFGWGIIDQLELGVAIDALSYGKDAQGAKFGGVDLYARYAFIDMLAAELRLYTPGDRTFLDDFGDQRLGVQLGLPFQWIAVAQMLKLHAELALDIGFVADGYPTSGGQTPQLALLLNYGVTFNAIPQLFMDLSFGTRMGLRPDAGSFGDRTAIPAAFTVGGTLVNGKLDIFANFALADLKPATGGAFDRKMVGIGGRFRF